MGISGKYLCQTRDNTEIYLHVEKQVGCTRMEGETRSGHLYRKPLYVSGPAEIMTQDTVNYAIEGASFEPLFARNTDDFMLGAILNRVGIFPFKLGNNGCCIMKK